MMPLPNSRLAEMLLVDRFIKCVSVEHEAYLSMDRS